MSSQLLISGFLLLTLSLSFILFFALRTTGDKLIFEKQSKYHHIMVYENGYMRTLRLGKDSEAGKQTLIDLRDPDALFLEYTKLLFAGMLITDKPYNILVIGLGGGVVPMAINRYIPDAEIDVVDIDGEVVDVAEKFFFFKLGRNIRVHILDGRSFIKQKIADTSFKKYDMVILDAFNSSSIPEHLLTKEFLKELVQVLDSKGVVAANVLSDNKLFHSILKTYQKVFKRYYLFMGGQARNAILVAPGIDAPDLDAKQAGINAEILQERYHFNFSMASVARQFRPGYPSAGSGKVLTDSQKE